MRARVAVTVGSFLAMVVTGLVLTAPVAAGDTPAEQKPATPESGASAAGDSAARESQVVLMYFHGSRRCKTCLSIEANAVEVLKSDFAEQLESGELTWKTVNYDEPENKHFIKDFGLVSASLVIVETNNGELVRHDVLDKAWSLIWDESRFERYVRASLLDFLG